MKFNSYNLLALACALSGSLLLGSCNDFLDREPLDQITPQAYFNTEADLAAFVIKQYDILPNGVAQWNMGPIALGDNDTDNQAKGSGETKYWEPGQWRVPENEEKSSLDEQEWRFTRIRAFNFFFQEVLPKKEAGLITGSEANLNQYIGEMYFLRAYEYFTRLKLFGDFPIVTEVLNENSKDSLVMASQRRPRNEVARFILSDLDKAISLMTSTDKNRLTRNAALLFKSRVALYEATFETYHKNTPRVPGGPDWPGAKMDYNKGFSIDLDQEIAFFTDQALAAAKEVADQITLTNNSGQIDPQKGQTAGWNPYFEMFGDQNMNSYKEVIMWRAYDVNINVANAFDVYIFNGNNTGLTKGYVETFLMKNGLPIYANGSGYTGDDKTLDKVKINRDDRLQLFMVSEHTRKNVYTEDNDSISWYYTPNVIDLAEVKKVTGYHIRKGLNYTYDSRTTGSGISQTNGLIYFRGVEAMLNYMEASCLKSGGTSIDATAQGYWKQIRQRAGVDEDFMKTVNNTDLSKEDDWAVYSGGAPVSSLMYNIRRERRCEFIAEGMRWDDLIRWRALDQVENYIIQGCNFWDEMHKDPMFITTNKETGQKESKLIPAGTPDKTPNVSSLAESGKYLCPYRIIQKNNGLYDGYTWMKANYLHPVCINHMRITSNDGKDVTTSPIYQNPYWPVVPNTAQLE